MNGKRIWLSVEITPYKEFGDLVIYTIKDRTELMTEEQKWLRAHTDSLTGLFNKYTLDYHYGIRSHRDPLHVIYLDIDNFKDVNDTYGHYAGDSTLIRFANILKSHSQNTIDSIVLVEMSLLGYSLRMKPTLEERLNPF